MQSKRLRVTALLGAAALVAGCGNSDAPLDETLDPALVAQGQQVFRFETFGDEAQWRR
jgi:hypothetical protein